MKMSLYTSWKVIQKYKKVTIDFLSARAFLPLSAIGAAISTRAGPDNQQVRPDISIPVQYSSTIVYYFEMDGLYEVANCV